MSPEILLMDGRVAQLRFTRQPGRPPLQPSEQRLFEELVHAKADNIVRKWIDFFVLHKHVPAELLTRKLK